MRSDSRDCVISRALASEPLGSVAAIALRGDFLRRKRRSAAACASAARRVQRASMLRMRVPYSR